MIVHDSSCRSRRKLNEITIAGGTGRRLTQQNSDRVFGELNNLTSSTSKQHNASQNWAFCEALCFAYQSNSLSIDSELVRFFFESLIRSCRGPNRGRRCRILLCCRGLRFRRGHRIWRRMFLKIDLNHVLGDVDTRINSEQEPFIFGNDDAETSS